MDHADANLRDMLNLGIKAAQAKHKTEAYQLLSQVVRRDPTSEQGWLWLAAVAPTPQESLDAFNRVLAINPTSEQAQVGRRWASARLATPPAAPAVVPAPDAAPGPATPPAVVAGRVGDAATVFAPAATVPPSASVSVPDAPVLAPAAAPAPPDAAPAPPLVAPAVGPDAWRAAGDLTVQGSGVNWDDSGADLSGLDSLSSLDSGAYPSTDGGLDPSLRGVVYTPDGATARAVAPAVGGTRTLPAEPAPMPASYGDAISPVGGRSSLMPLLLGGLLLLAGLLLALSGLLKTAGPDDAAQQFFKAHLQKNYPAADLLLASTLQTAYMPAKDLPDLNLTAALAGVPDTALQPPAPLAVSPDTSKAGSQAESYITIQPPGKPLLRYLVHLRHDAGGKWLIDEILPASAPPAANP